MRPRRILLGAMILGGLAIVGCAVLLTTTTSYSYERATFIGRPGDPRAPGWTRPCRRDKGVATYILPCARARGIVSYRQVHDPDGDADVHVLVAVGRRLVIVKGRASSHLPGTGHRVDVAGTVTKGRYGLTVVDIRRKRQTPLAPPR